MLKASLDGALIGNSAISALIDSQGNIIWSCFPRLDGDPVFCSLLSPARREEGAGAFTVRLEDYSHAEQSYVRHTAVLTTRLHDNKGGIVELTDFAPRFKAYGRVFHPAMLVRRLRRVAGNPRIAVGVQPLFQNGEVLPQTTCGSHHIRYAGPEQVLRLTTDMSIHAIQEERVVHVHDTLHFMLGADETLQGGVADTTRRFLEETVAYWQSWVRTIFVPVDWQDEVIRAAITLKLNACDDTGAIIAAMTSSIPEHPDSGRNWDYRYCWLRDAYFVVNALNRLGATATMERYIGFIVDVAASAGDGLLQPVFGISGEARLTETIAPALAGYRGMGPVRIGNQAYEQVQHDVYGSAILAATHMFFDSRLHQRGDENLFRQLEPLGLRALANYRQPDAGLWELRGSRRIHTYSSVLCWAACDRLARIAVHIGLEESARSWREAADRIHAEICVGAWSPAHNAFMASWGGDTLDASLLLLSELGFLDAADPRFAQTVEAIEAGLKHGNFIYRYIERDDFGHPQNAFIVCTFWYVYALHALGRHDEALQTFQRLLECCNPQGLLAEDVDPQTGEQWGNFVQTYSMVGLINCALRLSRRWDEAY